MYTVHITQYKRESRYDCNGRNKKSKDSGKGSKSQLDRLEGIESEDNKQEEGERETTAEEMKEWGDNNRG